MDVLLQAGADAEARTKVRSWARFPPPGTTRLQQRRSVARRKIRRGFVRRGGGPPVNIPADRNKQQSTTYRIAFACCVSLVAEASLLLVDRWRVRIHLCPIAAARPAPLAKSHAEASPRPRTASCNHRTGGQDVHNDCFNARDPGHSEASLCSGAVGKQIHNVLQTCPRCRFAGAPQ